jgi:hypothetical protein
MEKIRKYSGWNTTSMFYHFPALSYRIQWLFRFHLFSAGFYEIPAISGGRNHRSGYGLSVFYAGTTVAAMYHANFGRLPPILFWRWHTLWIFFWRTNRLIWNRVLYVVRQELLYFYSYFLSYIELF